MMWTIGAVVVTQNLTQRPGGGRRGGAIYILDDNDFNKFSLIDA